MVKDSEIGSPLFPIGEYEQLSLSGILRILFRNYKLIVAITVLAMVISVVYALLQKDSFMARASFYQEESGASKFGGIEQIAANLTSSGSTSYQLFKVGDVVYSHEVLEKVINTKYTSRNYDSPVDLIEYFQLSELPPLERQYEIFKIMRENIKINSPAKSILINLEVAMPEPQLAEQVANATVNAIQEYLEKVRNQQALENLGVVEIRIDSVYSEMLQAENALEEFLEMNRGYQQSPRLMMEYQRLQRQLRLKEQVYGTLQRQYELGLLETIKEGPSIQILNNAVEPTQRFKPKRRNIVMIFSVLGFFLSIFGVLLVDFLFRVEAIRELRFYRWFYKRYSLLGNPPIYSE